MIRKAAHRFAPYRGKGLTAACLSAILISFACNPGAPPITYFGIIVITFAPDSARCEPDHDFFFFVDGAIVNTESYGLPFSIGVKGGEHVIRARCTPGTTLYGWIDTLVVTSDTTLIVPCEECKE